MLQLVGNLLQRQHIYPGSSQLQSQGHSGHHAASAIQLGEVVAIPDLKNRQVALGRLKKETTGRVLARIVGCFHVRDL